MSHHCTGFFKKNRLRYFIRKRVILFICFAPSNGRGKVYSMNPAKALEAKRVIHIETNQERVSSLNLFLMRALNMFLALLLLILFSPVMLLIFIMIYFLEGKPVFYRGKRIGRNGVIFNMYKFRTLYKGAENKIGSRLMKDNEGFITPLGHFLRRFKLDELPQLYNIVKGDMNFIGPRPVRPLMAEEYRRFVPQYEKRFRIKPGLTGLAQLRGGYYCNPRHKTHYDLFYIRKRNFIFDIKLFLLTAVRFIVSPHCLKRGYNANGRPTGFCSPCKEFNEPSEAVNSINEEEKLKEII